MEDQLLLCGLNFPNLTLQLQLNQMMLQKKCNGKKKQVGKRGLTQAKSCNLKKEKEKKNSQKILGMSMDL